jgi:SpoVK/Ycf46/Vps4 family AAA+-type ATPase
MIEELFGDVLEFPDPDAQERFSRLIGIGEVKNRIVREATLLLDPEKITKWSETHHGKIIRAATELAERTPLIILAGDVGTGKTELAETFLDEVVRKTRSKGTLYALSLSVRGKGGVGEMTKLISDAMTIIRDAGRKAVNNNHVIVLMIDEGDALAQSREMSQMHHEDRVGVNALLKGIDSLRRARLPVLTVLCTNRVDSIDPALRRRAAASIALERPNSDQRRAIFSELLEGIDVSSEDLDQLVELTGPHDSREYGMTYSDIRQRLIPESVLSVFDSGPLTAQVIIESAKKLEPTRPFNGNIK